MAKRTPEMRARLRKLAADGLTAREIVADLKVSLPSVLEWARLDGIKLPSRHESRRRTMAARAAAKPASNRLIIPPWVPDHLRDLYRAIARDTDEFVAASRIRKLKRAATAQHQEA